MRHVLLLLLSLTAAAEAENQPLHYVLLVPAELHFPSTEQVCLQLHGVRDQGWTIDITVTLGVQGQKITLYNRKEHCGSPLQCYSFTYHIVELKDPNSNRVAQWLDIIPKLGIVDLSFILTSDPPLGTYTINVDSGKTYKTFAVQEQVLPRFEVTIEKPSQIFALDKSFPVKVCGRYTYGKGVEGNGTITLCKERSGSNLQGPHDNCYHLEGQTDFSGCISASLNSSLFSLTDSRFFSYQIMMRADVEEKGTGEKEGYFNGTATASDTTAVPLYPNAYHTVQPFYSAAQSYLRLQPIFGSIPCGYTVHIRVEYELSKADLNVGNNMVTFNYIVVGKAGILLHGQRLIPITNRNPVKGVLAVPVTFTSDFTPSPKMLGYILLDNGKVTADRLHFKVNMCFPNKVALKFPRTEALPRSLLSLHLVASPMSLCALRAVDKSVQISYPEEQLTAEMVYSLFPYSVRSGYPSQVDEDVPNPCWGWDPIPMRRFPSEIAVSRWWPSWITNELDVLSLFKDIGVKILTNTLIMKPKTQMPRCEIFLRRPEIVLALPMVAEPQLPSVDLGETIRRYFPETWIWDLVPISKSGSADISVTVPDTITDWNFMTFCMGPSGFGLSSPASLRTFQPFFVELALPYSVVRGETFILKASVFNYLNQCIKVQVTIPSPPNAQVTQCPGCHYASCVCATRAVTFKWDVTATKVGLVTLTVKAEAVSSEEPCNGQMPVLPPSGQTDTVQRQLLVKPGGIRKEITRNFFYCLESENASHAEAQATLPEATGPTDAESAYITVMGDLLGTALQNLDHLITMPSGCGEQNMLTFAPIIYVLQYLQATGQLNDELGAKAIGYLQSGYQRELTYKHADGSYSAFGESDGAGSTWLTAFVVKCFSQAKGNIFIDDAVISKAVSWLRSRQLPGGCFISSGKLFHTLMKDGVQDDVSLSEYITAALLELGIPQNVSMRDWFLRAHWGQLHWMYMLQSSEGESGGSANVELTSYVLLALISGPTVQAEELSKASEIVNWLNKQQNPYGGFSSTQDTVVAIQALAKYTRVTFNDKGNMLVTVQTAMSFQKQFHVDKYNRLLLQREALPDVPGSYSLQVTGIGCVYIQVVLRYNVYPQMEKATFNLSARLEPRECTNQSIRLETLIISVSYTRTRNVSNMVLIEVDMLSGFSPREDTAIELLKMPLVMRVNIQQNSVTIYLDELGHSSQDYSLTLKQDDVVGKLQPANVKVCDYYKPEESSVRTYLPSCP